MDELLGGRCKSGLVQGGRQVLVATIRITSTVHGKTNRGFGTLLVDVFSRDTRGHLRGVGSTISKKQLSHMGVASQKLQKLEQNDVSNQQMRQDIIKVNTDLNGFGRLLENLIQEVRTSKVSATETQVVGLNSVSRSETHHLFQTVHRVFAPPPLFLPAISRSETHHLVKIVHRVFAPIPSFRPIEKPLVILTDVNNRDLAKGYVETDPLIQAVCHGRKVGRREVKIYVEDVLEPDVLLWALQNGLKTMGDLIEGGYTIWMESWLKFNEV